MNSSRLRDHGNNEVITSNLNINEKPRERHYDITLRSKFIELMYTSSRKLASLTFFTTYFLGYDFLSS